MHGNNFGGIQWAFGRTYSVHKIRHASASQGEHFFVWMSQFWMSRWLFINLRRQTWSSNVVFLVTVSGTVVEQFLVF